MMYNQLMDLELSKPIKFIVKNSVSVLLSFVNLVFCNYWHEIHLIINSVKCHLSESNPYTYRQFVKEYFRPNTFVDCINVYFV